MKLFCFAIFFSLWHYATFAQQNIGVNTINPDASAQLDVSSTDKGFLIPRLTLAQRNAIISPAKGLLIFQTDSMPGVYYNSGTPGLPNWARLAKEPLSLGQAGNTVYGTGLVNPPGGGFVLVPGLSQTINIPSDAIIFVSTHGGVQTTSSSTTGVSRVHIALMVDGVQVSEGGLQRIIAANTGGETLTVDNWSMSQTVSLTQGMHTISVSASLVSGSTANVSGDTNSVLQGSLTVLILKQ